MILFVVVVVVVVVVVCISSLTEKIYRKNGGNEDNDRSEKE